MYTDLIKEKELSSIVRKACEDIENISKDQIVISSSGVHRDPVQTLVMRRGSNSDFLISPIIEAAAIQAEIKAAGSGESFLRIVSSGIREDYSRRAAGVDQDDEWNSILENIEKLSIPCRKKDIPRIFGNGGETYKKIIEESFDLIQCDDSVSVKKSPSQKTEITRESGYTFDELSVDPRFFYRGSWERKDVRVALIDGIIEKVSEIHHFLEEASKSKSPCVIFCIDALPDVVETLVKNFSMRNLDVIMVGVPVTHDHVNTLVDLGKIFGIRPIGASAGDSISMGLMSQNSKADKIHIARGKISIECESNKESTRSHLRDLRKRIEEDINLAQILEPRIQRLNSSTIRIKIGVEDQRKDPNIVEKLDRTFRSMSRILRFGFIEKIDFQAFSTEKIDLLFGVNHAISAEMAAQSIKVFLSTRESIRSAAIGIRKV